MMATVLDIHNRRIPNWLVLPFLTAGLTVATASQGMKGLGKGAGGIALAVAVTGILCWLRGMGMGDLKLCAAVGSWIGPGQLGIALVATGIAGGVLALFWAAYHGSLRESLDGSLDLVSRFWTKGIRPHPSLVLDNPSARTMPYAPAIAIGTIFSFFCNLTKTDQKTTYKVYHAQYFGFYQIERPVGRTDCAGCHASKVACKGTRWTAAHDCPGVRSLSLACRRIQSRAVGLRRNYCGSG
jgi:prepilin peptidase CpaA